MDQTPPVSEAPAPAPVQTPAGRPGGLRRVIIELVQTALQALVLYFLITAFVGRFEIHQTSMEPNFHEGQRVVVSKFGSLFSPWLAGTAYAADGRAAALLGPKRGQVVVFYPDAAHTQDPLIKRVIGLPGETVEVRDGGVYVDGQRLDEPYVHGLPTTCFGGCGPIHLGVNQYFMLGDNRPNSRDSRSIGPIPLERIIGEVMLRYWPMDKLQWYP